MTDSMPAITTHTWDTKYRYRRTGEVVDVTIEDTWRRVAKAAARNEADPGPWEERFHDILSDFRFLPGGRILANAGTDRETVTMLNCYVMGTISDSMEGIFETVKEAALTQKQGGGVGFDFSTVRPKGDHVKGVDSAASGPVSFMRVLNETCRTIMSAGSRRGAQMGVMRCDHPDVEEFIDAKRTPGQLEMFNLSVAITDDFVNAVESGASDWPLVFGGTCHRTVSPAGLWEKIMRSTYDYAEPGVLFIDTVNRMNNLWYCERIAASNPCGEQPLGPYGACLLGSVNLTRFVKDGALDLDGIERTVAVAVRFLDNILDLSKYPLEQQRAEAMSKRRMGIGVTGLADALIMLGARYGDAAALRITDKALRAVTCAAYKASVDLAKEKGAFPLFDAEKYLQGEFVKTLPLPLRQAIRTSGIRNSHLTSIAPTGTISLLAGNVSSGIEPVFGWKYTRNIRTGDGDEVTAHEVRDWAYDRHIAAGGDAEALPPHFVTADDLQPEDHLRMQAAAQRWVDSAISKTINVPEDFPYERFKDIYREAFRLGLKGCTTYRPNAGLKSILVKDAPKAAGKPRSEPPAKAHMLQERPEALYGLTYKVRTPLSPDAFYVTINDVVDGGVRRPYEMFINTKNLQHLSWIVAMTRLISAVFRREVDASFLVDELKSIYDPEGGYFSGGEYVPSLPAEMGRVLKKHMIRIGLIPDTDPAEAPAAAGEQAAPEGRVRNLGPICPKCSQPGMVMSEGCPKCLKCGHSLCG